MVEIVPNTVIDVQVLRKVFRDGWFWGKRLEALRGVSLQVQAGEIFGLLGPNGAGKTTLIKILLGILHPSSGGATVLGLPAGSQSARQRIGYLPENMAFPRHHTGLDAMYFYGKLSRLSATEIRRKTMPLIELVGLAGREREPVRKYSKGMRQRLGLAQAMLHDPQILIMDEPTDGLDPLGRSQIRRVIEQLKAEGKTIFLNSHILQEVELICDRVAIMAHGEIHRVGTIRELTMQMALAARTEVTLELIGKEEHLQAALEPFSHQRRNQSTDDSGTSSSLLDASTPDQGNRIDVLVNLDSPLQIDELIDRLRSNHVRILQLHRSQPRLEEVFMSVVETANLQQANGGRT